MAFDPDQYIKANSQFNPDEYLQQNQAPAGVSKLESLGRGAVQGATLGFGEEIGAGLAAPFVAAKRALIPSEEDQKLAELQKQGFNLPESDKTKTNIADIYRELRDTTRKSNKQAEETNPYTYLAGQIFGGAAPVIATGGLGAAPAEASLAAKVGMGAAAGAGFGAAQGLGTSEADLTKGDIGQAAKDTGMGAGVGAVLGGAIPGITNVAKGVGNYLSEMPYVKDITKAVDISARTGKRVTGEAASEAAAENQGKNILEAQDIVSGQRNKLGQEFKSTLGTEPEVDANGIIYQQIQKAQKIADSAKFDQTRTAADSLAKELEEFRAANPGKISLEDLANLEQKISSYGNSGRELAQMGSDFRNIVRGSAGKEGEEAIPGLLGEKGPEYQNLMGKWNELRKAQGTMGKKFGNLNESDIQSLDKIAQQLRGLAGQGETGMAKKGVLEKAFFDTLKKGASNPEELSQIENLQQNMSDEAWRRVLSAKGESKNILFMLGHLLLGSGTRIGETVGLAANQVSGMASNVSKGLGLPELMNAGNKAIQSHAANLEAAGKTTQAQFLKNFASSDVNKKKAMLFSASQNPQLRDSLKSEISENKE